MQLTKDVPSASARSSAAQSSAPLSSTPITRTSCPMAFSASKDACTEGCSTALSATSCLPRIRDTVPITARLLPSVPPEVKYSSHPLPRTVERILSRALRSLRKASTDGRYTEEGL